MEKTREINYEINHENNYEINHENFWRTVQEYDNKLAVLESLTESVSNEVQQLGNAFKDCLEVEALGEKPRGDKDAIRKKLQDAEAKLKELTFKVDIIKKHKKESLESMVDRIREWKNNEVQRLQARYSEQAKDVLQKKKEYLESVKAMGETRREAGKLHGEFERIRSFALPGSRYEYLYWQDATFFHRLGSADHSGDLGVWESEITNAYKNCRVNVKTEDN